MSDKKSAFGPDRTGHRLIIGTTREGMSGIYPKPDGHREKTMDRETRDDQGPTAESLPQPDEGFK